MKKISITILSVLLIFFSITSCGKKEVTGGYSSERDITSDDVKIFNTALGADSDNYEPLNVATQVVSGTNYKFYSKDLTSKTDTFVNIIIYVSLDKNEAPTVTDIIPLKKGAK